MIKRITYLLFIAVASACLSFAGFETASAAFVIPQAWPKPVYDFSKNKITEGGFKLGRALFFDPLLSRDSSISCSSCHLQFTGFTHVDHSLSHGINGLKGTRNASTLFNLAWSPAFMWDGGATNLETQAINPITSAVEMDNTLENVVLKLNRSARYRKLFFKAYSDSVVTSQRLLKALAQFTLLFESYNARYDKVMRQENGASFTPAEENGYVLFRRHCASCHAEPLFTNHSFKNTGLPLDRELNDLGRMAITGNKNDSLKFKVPSLRNVAVSGPYMHDGRFRSLEQVIEHYTGGMAADHLLAGELQKGIHLSDPEKKDLVAFLHTLTDKEFLYDLRFRNYIND